MSAQILEFPIIPLKPADRPQTYKCIQCAGEMTWPWRVNHPVYCEYDGALMRPVEGGK